MNRHLTTSLRKVSAKVLLRDVNLSVQQQQDQCRKLYNLVSLSSDLYRSLTYQKPVLFLLLTLHRPHNLPPRRPYLLALLYRQSAPDKSRMMILNSARFGVVWISELREHVNTWLISTKNAVRPSNSSRTTVVLFGYLKRTDPAVLRRCVFLCESFDVVDTRTSFKPSTASSNRNMELKTSTASTNVQLRRMAKSWGIAGARSRSDTLLIAEYPSRPPARTLENWGNGSVWSVANIATYSWLLANPRYVPLVRPVSSRFKSPKIGHWTLSTP